MIEIENIQQFTSFEQCNQILQGLEEIDLHTYLRLANKVPYDHDLVKRYPHINSQSYWMNIILEFIINISNNDPREFKITVVSLEEIGFNYTEYPSRFPLWIQTLFNCHDSVIKKEKRLLKSYKLCENIDYVMKLEEIDGEVVQIGHRINRIVLYRMITMKYGIRFTECILARLSQIIYYFNEYKYNYRSEQINSLQRTIIGLTEDIQDLNTRFPRLSETQNFIVENSYETAKVSPVSSGLIMDDKEYCDELSLIHRTIEACINKVDGRISDMNLKLTDITNKIDELVGSITLNAEESKLGSCVRCSILPDNPTDPVFNHVQSIIDHYNNTNKYDCQFEQCL